MPVQAHPTRRKTRWSTQPPRPSAGPHAQPYRRRRPETTTLHRIVREHLETYLALANEADPMGEGVPDHVEKEFRSYLECGILVHGFARARCSSCGHDFLVAFSCKGRGACPSCNAKRMAETAAHLVDHVFPSCRYGCRSCRHCSLPVLAVYRRICHRAYHQVEMEGFLCSKFRISCLCYRTS